MQRALIAVMLLLPLAGGSQTQKGAGVGATGGALIGGLAAGSWEGAVAGGATGALIGRASEPGTCVYRDRRGREYIERC